jgi:hypothetical protein
MMLHGDGIGTRKNEGGTGIACPRLPRILGPFRQ